MSLPTNRMPGDIIEAVDINQIAEEVNRLASDSGTSVTEVSAIATPIAADAEARAKDYAATLAYGTNLEATDATVAAFITSDTDTRLALEDRDRGPRPTTGVPVNIADSGTNNPYWLGRDRRTLYRGGGSGLRTSVDDGATWQTPTPQLFNPYIIGVRDLANGEVLVSTAAASGTPGSLWLSSGGISGTWSKVLDAGRDAGGNLVGPSSHFSGNWGMDSYDNIVVVSEYGLQRPDLGDQARFVWLSTDYGQTWTRIYDIGTAAQAHVHGVLYDPWWKAIWVSQGDSINRAVKVSFNSGSSWTTVSNPSNVQVVGGLAMPGCVLFGTDYQPDGIYRVNRTPDRTGLVLESAYQMAGGAVDRRRYIAGMPYWTGRQGDPALFPFIADETFTAPGKLIATVDGFAFQEVWSDTRSYQHAGLWKSMGPTVTGAYLGELQDDRGPVRSRLRLSYLPPLRPAVTGGSGGVTARDGAGSFTTGDVVTIGKYAKHQRSDAGTSLVAGGSPNYENVIGGNPANVNTATSNLAGAAALTGQDGNWVFILSGYDNVVNGWANVVNGFHNIAHAGSNHVTISGGSNHVVNAAVAYGTIGGGTGHKLTGNVSTIGGGQDNETATNAYVGGGLRNKATGNSATITGGLDNTASAQSAAVAGGFNGVASANSATVGGGQQNTASGQGSTVPGGRENVAAAAYSVATGRQAKTANNGEHAHGAGVFTVAGDAQVAVIPVKRQTTDATAADMQCEGGLPPIIPENTTWAFRAIVAARRADVDGENAAWEVKGLLKRDAASTAALVGTPTVAALGANGGNTWTLTVANYSSGHLRFVVTGEAGKTIRWVGRLELAQVGG